MRARKEERGEIRKENDKIREEIKKEEQNASQFKFTKMVRKPPYKPLVHQTEVFGKESQMVEVHGPSLTF